MPIGRILKYILHEQNTRTRSQDFELITKRGPI